MASFRSAGGAARWNWRRKAAREARQPSPSYDSRLVSPALLMLGAKTLLVNPPLVGGIAFTRQGRCQEREEVLGTTKPPYTLALIAALLRERGCDVRLVDLTATGESVDDSLRPARRRGLPPTLVLFPSTTPTLDADVAAMARIKARYGAPALLLRSPRLDDTARVDGTGPGRRRHVRRRAGRWRARAGDARLAATARDHSLPDVPRGGRSIVPHRAHGTFTGFRTRPIPPGTCCDLDRYRVPLVDKPYVLVESSAAVRTRATSAWRRSTTATSSGSRSRGARR